MASPSVSRFCSNYGKRCDTGKFCTVCGVPITEAAPVNEKVAAPSPTLSLEAFKARKESVRSSFFRSSNVNKKPKREEKVTIKIGLFRYDPVKHVLKDQWGQKQNLTIDKNSTYAAILEKAIEKRRAHDRHFKAESEGEEYQLLYPDGSHALFLPGKPDCNLLFRVLKLMFMP